MTSAESKAKCCHALFKRINTIAQENELQVCEMCEHQKGGMEICAGEVVNSEVERLDALRRSNLKESPYVCV